MPVKYTMVFRKTEPKNFRFGACLWLPFEKENMRKFLFFNAPNQAAYLFSSDELIALYDNEILKNFDGASGHGPKWDSFKKAFMKKIDGTS